MNIRLSLLIVLIPCLFACNILHDGKQIKHILNQKISDTLLATTVHVNANLLMPVKLITVDDKLIVYDRGLKTELFKVFNLNNLKYLFSYGEIGRGPEEFLFINDKSINCFNNTLVLLDKFRFKSFQIDDNNFTPINSFPVRVIPRGVNNFTLLNDTIYLCNNSSCAKNKEFLVINIKTRKILNSFSDFPNLPNNLKSCNDINSCCNKLVTYNPLNDKIAVFYLYMHRMRLFGSKRNIIKDVIVGDGKIINHTPNGSERIYTVVAYSTPNFIYCLNINAPEDSVFNNKNCTPLLEIWDWNGNLKATYKFNKEIMSFCISENLQKIYATTLNGINDLYVFKLPNVE